MNLNFRLSQGAVDLTDADQLQELLVAISGNQARLAIHDQTMLCHALVSALITEQHNAKEHASCTS